MTAFREGQLESEQEINHLLSGDWKENNFSSPQEAIYAYGLLRQFELRDAISDGAPDECIERRRGRLSKYD